MNDQAKNEMGSSAIPTAKPGDVAAKLQDVSTKMVIYEGIIREALETLRIGHKGFSGTAISILEKSGIVTWPHVPAGQKTQQPEESKP